MFETDFLNNDDLALNGLAQSWLQKRDNTEEESFVDINVSENGHLGPTQIGAETTRNFLDTKSESGFADFDSDAPIYHDENKSEERPATDSQYIDWQYDDAHSDETFDEIESHSEADADAESSSLGEMGVKEPQLLRRPIVPLPHAYHHVAAPSGLPEFWNEAEASDQMISNSEPFDSTQASDESLYNAEEKYGIMVSSNGETSTRVPPPYVTADSHSDIEVSYIDRRPVDFLRHSLGTARLDHPIRYRPFRHEPWHRVIPPPYQHNYLNGLPMRSITKTVTTTATTIVPDPTTIYATETEYADPVTEVKTTSEVLTSYETVVQEPSTLTYLSYLTETTVATHTVVLSSTILQQTTITPSPQVPPLFSDMKLFQAVQAPIVRTITAPCAALESRTNLAMKVSAGSVGVIVMAFTALVLQIL